MIYFELRLRLLELAINQCILSLGSGQLESNQGAPAAEGQNG
ncbi:unnamed protein product [Acidithrix sp. C25]|nr:unnamed protein product [Acidithrix sp. C25]